MIVPLLLAAIALLLAYIGSHDQLSTSQTLFVVVFFGVGGLFVLFPQAATRVAGWLNVGRGADLLLYFAVLSGVLIAANFYFRFKQTERAFIRIVREMALNAPLKPEQEGDSC